MVIVLLMALAVLFGALVLVSLAVGRMYEVRHKVGELTEEMEQNDELLRQLSEQGHQAPQERDSKEKV